jgi:outer membrane protein W
MKKVLYILLFAVIASSALAQESMMSWQYSMGFGTGDLHDFIKPASFRGVTFNYNKFIKPGVAVGFEIGWNTFYEQKDYATYTSGNFDYSGKQWRYSNQVPLLFNAGYYMSPDEQLTPFVGFGIGTIFSERRTDMSQYIFTLDAWHFALKPELGVLYNTDGASLSLSSKYYYGFKTGDLPAEGFFTINVGLVIKR